MHVKVWDYEIESEVIDMNRSAHEGIQCEKMKSRRQRRRAEGQPRAESGD